MYKLITFDANGTLLKLRYPVGQIYSAIAKKYGIESEPTKIEKGFKFTWISMNDAHPNFGLSTIGWRSWWKKVVFQSFKQMYEGDMYSEKSLEPVAEKLVDIFSSNEGWDVNDGCVDTLEKLKSKNLKIGIVSNFDPRLHGVLKSLKINQYFDFVLTSYEAGVMKPDEKIFRIAEKLSELNIADEERGCILHVGDNLEFDYFAPIKAGWKAAIVSKKKDQILASNLSLDNKNFFLSLSDFKEII